MDSVKVLRFDEALASARSFVASEMADLLPRTVLVRDIYGRIRLALDDRNAGPDLDRKRIAEVAARLGQRLGSYSPGPASPFLFASEMIAPDEIFSAPEISGPREGTTVRLLDRQVMGADWSRPPFSDGDVNRLALYGIKGGVGRSTAAAVLCWRFSLAGKRVLVVDLDLESPGVGTTLLPEDREPDFGIVDWFVEDAVGQADKGLVPEMLARSPIGAGGAEVIIVPAGGRAREGYSYLPKLARCYAEVTSAEGSFEFGDRLHRLIRSIEQAVSPDVTILDSRAGLHDIAAVAVTRMNALSLLFAVDSPQTWRAYELLFQEWKADPSRTARFRENLKMVAAQIPETETLPYLDSFRENAYRLFEEHLYEEAAPDQEAEFSFDLNDPDAPHYPLRINWARSMQQFDPVRRPGAVTDEQVSAAFGDFVNETSRMVFGESVK